MIRAGAANVRGEPQQALGHYERAAAIFADCSMSAHLAAARHRAGVLRGGDEGAMLVELATEYYQREDVRNQDRFLEAFAPAGLL
jgi:hypothetical protein